MARGYYGHQGPLFSRFFIIRALRFGVGGRIGRKHVVPAVSCTAYKMCYVNKDNTFVYTIKSITAL